MGLTRDGFGLPEVSQLRNLAQDPRKPDFQLQVRGVITNGEEFASYLHISRQISGEHIDHDGSWYRGLTRSRRRGCPG